MPLFLQPSEIRFRDSGKLGLDSQTASENMPLFRKAKPTLPRHFSRDVVRMIRPFGSSLWPWDANCKLVL